ncbi:hypothetical protein TgHK011_008834 [Trichoderma gracile]|nr:hypothetical protein TgHK011_008834 [Trichoderma gracile]
MSKRLTVLKCSVGPFQELSVPRRPSIANPVEPTAMTPINALASIVSLHWLHVLFRLSHLPLNCADTFNKHYEQAFLDSPLFEIV